MIILFYKERIQRLKQEGKFLTQAQKQKKAQAEAQLQAMLAQGSSTFLHSCLVRSDARSKEETHERFLLIKCVM